MRRFASRPVSQWRDPMHIISRLLILSLVGAFFCFFALDRGATESLLELAAFLAVCRFAMDAAERRSIPPLLLGLVAVVALLVALSLAFSFEATHSDRLLRLLKLLGIVFAVYTLRSRLTSMLAGRLLMSLLLLTVVWQLLAVLVFRLPHGAFSNPHYLAQVAALSLPFLAYCAATSRPVMSAIYVLVGLLTLNVLATTGSRPTILALLAASATIIGVYGNRRTIAGFCGGLVLLSAFLGITDYAGIASDFSDLLHNVSSEERVQIWSDSIRMLMDNSALSWLVGNGIGSFPSVFSQYSATRYSFLSFPHNYFIQLLFESGVIGLLVVMGGFSFLAVFLARLRRLAQGRDARLWVACLMVAFGTWFLMTNVIFDLYSNYALYSLGFLLGALVTTQASWVVRPAPSRKDDVYDESFEGISRP